MYVRLYIPLRSPTSRSPHAGTWYPRSSCSLCATSTVPHILCMQGGHCAFCRGAERGCTFAAFGNLQTSVTPYALPALYTLHVGLQLEACRGLQRLHFPQLPFPETTQAASPRILTLHAGWSGPPHPTASFCCASVRPCPPFCHQRLSW